MTVMVVLHDLNLAARYADEVWLLDEGRLMASGSWQRVLVPEVLEPVYRVKLKALTVAGASGRYSRWNPVSQSLRKSTDLAANTL